MPEYGNPGDKELHRLLKRMEEKYAYRAKRYQEHQAKHPQLL
jgi:hypothetical protein